MKICLPRAFKNLWVNLYACELQKARRHLGLGANVYHANLKIVGTGHGHIYVPTKLERFQAH